VPKGICTTWVFDFLQEGDPVTFNGPHGDFAIRESDKEMIFIAGGSGMAPFRSILADLKQQGCQRTINYYFGARTEADLFLTDAMRQYEQALPGFTYVPALSDPKEDTSWEGDTGLITDVVGKYNEDCSDKQGYLCGSPGMIDACIEVLTKNGMPEEEIYYDKFA
jgi:Na+-transporting NADH:ubiquinone oxidoreductase subunit F